MGRDDSLASDEIRASPFCDHPAPNTHRLCIYILFHLSFQNYLLQIDFFFPPL